MWIRVITFKLKPGTFDEYRRIMGERSTAIVKGASGLRNVYMIENSAVPSAGNVSFWDTKEHAEAFSRTPDRMALNNALAPLLAAAPQVEVYEVTSELSHQQPSA